MMEKEDWDGMNYVSMFKMNSSCPALLILQCKIFFSTKSPPPVSEHIDEGIGQEGNNGGKD
jgi:hypothetical protein